MTCSPWPRDGVVPARRQQPAQAGLRGRPLRHHQRPQLGVRGGHAVAREQLHHSGNDRLQLVVGGRAQNRSAISRRSRLRQTTTGSLPRGLNHRPVLEPNGAHETRGGSQGSGLLVQAGKRCAEGRCQSCFDLAPIADQKKTRHKGGSMAGARSTALMIQVRFCDGARRIQPAPALSATLSGLPARVPR